MTETTAKENEADTTQERVEFALKLLGASAVLTALMGWPAVSVQFTAYGIPADLIEVRAAVRAGIPPAVTFMLLFGYGFFLRRSVMRFPKSGPASLPLFVLLVLQAFALFLPSVLVRFGGLFSAAFLALRTVALGFEFSVEGAWWIIALSVPSALFGVWAFTLPNRLLTKEQEIPEADIDKPNAGIDLEVDGADWRASLLLTKLMLSDYLMLAVHALSLWLIAWFARIFWPAAFSWLTVPTALFLAAVMTIFSSLFPLLTFLRRVDPDLLLGNLRAMQGFLILSAGLAILFFSMELYPQLPKEWGGGRPGPVSVLLFADKAPTLMDWQVFPKAGQVQLAPVYLLESEGDHLILVDRDTPPGRWVAVPLGAVVAMEGT